MNSKIRFNGFYNSLQRILKFVITNNEFQTFFFIGPKWASVDNRENEYFS